MRVALIDYEAGNLFSVGRALTEVGATPVRVSDPDALAAFDRVVLPGVGAFGAGIATLRARGLDQALIAHVHRGGALLGVCLGLQLLCTDSDERGHNAGLGLVRAPVRHLPTHVRVPHMGWHRVEPVGENPVIPTAMFAYFAHSQAVALPLAEAAGTVTHGLPIAAALCRDRLWATQFHPEKSGPDGLALLARFLEV